MTSDAVGAQDVGDVGQLAEVVAQHPHDGGDAAAAVRKRTLAGAGSAG